MNLLTKIEESLCIWSHWDHELDPHVCHQLHVLNLFQSFYKGDINPLIVAAMAEQQISEPP